MIPALSLQGQVLEFEPVAVLPGGKEPSVHRVGFLGSTTDVEPRGFSDADRHEVEQAVSKHAFPEAPSSPINQSRRSALIHIAQTKLAIESRPEVRVQRSNSSRQPISSERRESKKRHGGRGEPSLLPVMTRRGPPQVTIGVVVSR
jgi:hypothetical protein